MCDYRGLTDPHRRTHRTQTQVNAEAQKIGKEAEEANIIAAQVQQELDKALPALREAEAALDVLTKKDMSELKAYAKPPEKVEMTLNAVLTGACACGAWYGGAACFRGMCGAAC